MPSSYRQIKAELLDRIRRNIWPPGALLPGEIHLAEEFDCARATVSRAMRELVEEGILERKRRSGTRVTSSQVRKAQFSIPLTREEITSTGASYRYALVDRAARTAPGWLRAQIALPQDTPVLHLRCMHFAGNRPYQFEDRWINLTAVPEAKAAPFNTISPNEWLIREVPLSKGELVCSATIAPPEIADFLGISQGEAAFSMERTTWLDDVCVTYARLTHPSSYKMISQI